MSPLWFRWALLENGWATDVRLRISGGRIARIETAVAASAEDERHGVALPGMPNVHSHAFQRAMAGLTEVAGRAGDNFWSWRELMYRFVERLDPQDVEAVAALAYAEMLESGYTHVAEFHYLHNDQDGRPYVNPGEMAERIVAATHATGIRLTFLPVLYAHSNFGGAPPLAAQRRFINDIGRFARVLEASRGALRALEDANLGVAPHSLRAVTPEELGEAVRLAPAGPIHIHVAEQTKEVDDCLAWSRQRPVEWLLEHAPVDERWCLVHATHMTAEETRRAAASGAVAGLCPLTEANLGDGVFPGPEFLDAGGVYGIGSDSNVLIDPAQELRTLEYGQRLMRRQRNVFASAQRASTARRLYEEALAGGGRALGRDGVTLRQGASADIVSLDAERLALVDRQADALLDSWIFAAREPLIDCVWRRGAKLVVAGAHVAREQLAANYRRALQKLLA
ncbi:MAG TPA: formimidoylglutamate deiminase [Steroidobacteraceae bacterium]|nr:formimidoylglutamate deiminase [Steroidobacteraceae bacterium]